MSETEQKAPPSRAMTKKLADCKNLQEAFGTAEFRDRIAGAIPRHMNPDSMLRAFIQAAGKSPTIYRCDLRQSIGAFLSLSYLGLTPGTSLNHAHLIPFRAGRLRPGQSEKDQKYDLQVIIGYHGYIELAFRSGFVRDIQTGVVFTGERFEHEQGTNKFLLHQRNIDLDTSKMTPRCAYAVADLNNDGKEFEIMPWWEVLSIRNRSQAYRRALTAKNNAEKEGKRPPLTWTEAPWVAHEIQMGRKTAIRRLSNILPKCPELRAGIALDEQAERGTALDFGPVIDGTIVPEDGIPEVTTDDPIDPGSTFGMRETEQQSDQDPDQPTRTSQRQQTQPETQRQRPQIGFAAFLIDQHGEVIGAEHTAPERFCDALYHLYEPADGEARANLMEHNADAIEEARASPAAAQILAAMTSLPAADVVADAIASRETHGMFTAPVAVPVPDNAGKPVWAAWSRALREELLQCDPGDLEAWAEAQRDTVGQATAQTRMTVMRAMLDAFEQADISPPAWINLPQPRAAQEQPRQESENPAPSPESTPPKERSKDELRGDGLMADLDAMPLDQSGRQAFDILVKLETTRTFMARLRRENQPLFNTVREAFEAKNAQIPAAVSPLPGSAH